MNGNLPFYDIQDCVFILTYKNNNNVNSEKKIYLKERKTSSTVTNCYKTCISVYSESKAMETLPNRYVTKLQYGN